MKFSQPDNLIGPKTDPGSANYHMKSLRILLLLLSIKLHSVESKTGSSEFLNALSFIGNIRECDIQSQHFNIKLPELTSYATSSTSNEAVNKVIEQKYSEFRQEVRKWNYEQDKKRLDALSKGAALAFFRSHISFMQSETTRNSRLPGADESALLVPVLKGVLPRYRLKCISAKDEDMLGSLKNMIESSEEYAGLEKEMVLSAVHMLGIAVQIVKFNWTSVSEEDKRALCSDDRAIDCIREWDRNSTSLKILYLTFILYARQLIAHISNNTKDSNIVAKLQVDMERIIQTELPVKLMREVGQVENVTFAYNIYIGGKVCQGKISEIHVLFVKDVRKVDRCVKILDTRGKIEKVVNVFLESHRLYLSVAESYGSNFPNGWESLLDEVMREMSRDDFLFCENPEQLFV